MTDPIQEALDALRKAVLTEQGHMECVARLDRHELDKANATIEKLRQELVEAVKHGNRLEGEIARIRREREPVGDSRHLQPLVRSLQ